MRVEYTLGWKALLAVCLVASAAVKITTVVITRQAGRPW